MSRKKELSRYSKPNFSKRVTNLIYSYTNKINSILKAHYSLEEKTTLFFGANTHRTRINGCLVNRYFNHKITDSSIIVEYNNALVNLENNSVDIWRIINWTEFKSEFSILSQDPKLFEILVPFKDRFKNLYDDIFFFTVEVLTYHKLFAKRFKESTLKELYFLSYYSAPAFGACIAANNCQIKTIEVQHGPIGKYHLAYSSSKQSKFKELNILPEEIHLWHNNFVPIVNQTFKKCVVVGNYYLNQYSKENKGLNTSQKILISLQPKDSYIPKIYDKVILELKENYQIVIRLHPRLVKNKSLIHKLKEYRKQGVMISDPYSTPLHEDFQNCILHLTGYSGTTLEAYEMNIPSILYDPKAKSFFESFRDKRLVIFDFKNNEKKSLRLIYKYIKSQNSA